MPEGARFATEYVRTMHETPMTSFEATLDVRERRLARRLEGFGDIVFGFAVSQCALQLPIVHGHVELASAFPLFLYFGTFSLVATLWLAFHRLMSGTFVPTGIDLIGAFVYLALVSLFPYAMYGIAHTFGSEAGARAALEQYAALYAVMMGIAALLTLRNIRRGWHYSTSRERDKLWASFLRRAILSLEMAVALGLDLAFGPATAGFFLFSIPFAISASRFRFRHVPRSLAPRVAALE